MIRRAIQVKTKIYLKENTCLFCGMLYVPKSRRNFLTCGSFECKQERTRLASLWRSRLMHPGHKTQDELMVQRIFRILDIQEMLSRGMNKSAIARSLGVSRQAIDQYVDKYLTIKKQPHEVQ